MESIFYISGIATAIGAAAGAATDADVATIVVVACDGASVKTHMLFYSMLLFLGRRLVATD
jgi:hypothetical protein